MDGGVREWKVWRERLDYWNGKMVWRDGQSGWRVERLEGRVEEKVEGGGELEES